MRKVILTIMENIKYEVIKNYVDLSPKYGLKRKSKLLKNFKLRLNKLKDGLWDK
ncbi:MAG: hypothetical protein ACRC5R_05545 [Mycoplasmatales bacterium]